MGHSKGISIFKVLRQPHHHELPHLHLQGGRSHGQWAYKPVHQVINILLCIPNIYEITLHIFLLHAYLPSACTSSFCIHIFLLHAYLPPVFHRGNADDIREGSIFKHAEGLVTLTGNMDKFIKISTMHQYKPFSLTPSTSLLTTRWLLCLEMDTTLPTMEKRRNLAY